jgi:hypothetical protein
LSPCFPRTRRATALGSRPIRPWAWPGSEAGAWPGCGISTAKDALTTLIRRCSCGRSASRRPVHGSSCRGHGGFRPLCKRRMGPSSSGDKGSRKGGVSALSLPISSYMTRAMPGCSGNIPPSPSSALPRIASRMVRGRRQPTGSKPAWPPDGRRVIGNSIQSRPALCTGKMPTGAGPPRTIALTFSGRRCVPDGPGIAGGSA